MHSQQHQINETWTSRGQPIFGMGIGLSTGQVAAVLLGSDERLKYTLVETLSTWLIDCRTSRGPPARR
jgi:adenylate cyclase